MSVGEALYEFWEQCCDCLLQVWIDGNKMGMEKGIATQLLDWIFPFWYKRSDKKINHHSFHWMTYR